MRTIFAHSLQLTPSRLQTAPARVHFVPIPTQHMAAFSRVNTYSANGFVPVVAVAPQSTPSDTKEPTKFAPFQTRIQTYGVRHPIPQVPPQLMYTTWQYLPVVNARIHPYVPLFV